MEIVILQSQIMAKNSLFKHVHVLTMEKVEAKFFAVAQENFCCLKEFS